MDKELYKEEKAQWTITTEIGLKRSLVRIAKKNRRSLAAEVRVAIEEYLDREKAKNRKSSSGKDSPPSRYC
jgi:predicted transcriptional regulator